MTKKTIFISYHRDDNAHAAGRLYDRLNQHFGAGHIFMDIDTIELGGDFVNVITNAVGSCDVVLRNHNLYSRRRTLLADGEKRCLSYLSVAFESSVPDLWGNSPGYPLRGWVLVHGRPEGVHRVIYPYVIL